MPMLSLFSLSVKRLSRQFYFYPHIVNHLCQWVDQWEPNQAAVQSDSETALLFNKTVQTTVQTCEPLKRSESKEQLVHKSDIAGAHAATVLVVNMASDEDSNEDFVTYGAPLEPLEEGTKMCAMKLSFVWICRFLLRRSCECFNKNAGVESAHFSTANPRCSYVYFRWTHQKAGACARTDG